MIMLWFKKRSSKKQVAALAVELGLITKKDKLTFGKYRGLSVKTVLSKDPEYICWVHDNTSHKFVSDLIKSAREQAQVIALEKAARSHFMYHLDDDFDALSMGMAEDFH